MRRRYRGWPYAPAVDFQRRAGALAPSDVARMRVLVDEITAHDGAAPFGDGIWRYLHAPNVDDAATLAIDDDRLMGFGVVSRSDNFAAPHLALAAAVAPSVRHGDLAGRLVDDSVSAAREIAPLTIVAWTAARRDEIVDALLRAGLTEARRLHRMERRLPLDEEVRPPPGIAIRSFEPGHDEAAWLAVNNAAFANHPEQSGWIDATLARRMAEPWFDTEGFLLAEDADGLAGFCWTKQHPGGVGEIFVIGVDPLRQGTGLGRALVVAGLASLYERGSTTGMLYVDAANTMAVGLYEALGFEIVDTDVAFELAP